MQFTGAELITRLIERQGVTTLAGVPGGMCLPLYDALARSRIRHVLARHEQAAGFIAQGMARTTGRTEVCFATSGPGVTNLLTAIADAKLEFGPHGRGDRTGADGDDRHRRVSGGRHLWPHRPHHQA